MRAVRGQIFIFGLVCFLVLILSTECFGQGAVAFGANWAEQLGIGDLEGTPTQAVITGVSAVAGGEEHTLALKNDGTVWAWGDNEYGQLGNGTKIASNVPIQVSNLSSIKMISAGDWNSIAIREGETAWMWGDNLWGQLGNGTYIDSDSPIMLSALTNITAVAVGTSHSLAVKNGNNCSSTIVFSPSTLPNAAIGEWYSHSITASGGKSPYSYSISSGTMPSGLYLASTGSITGVPDEVGSFSFTITASDADGCQGSQSYTIEIDSVEPPVISFVQKLGNPFRLKVNGGNSHPDLKVYIGGDPNPWGIVAYKNSNLVVLKGGNNFKARFPKGVPVEIKVVNGDGGTATFSYTRY